MSARQPGTVTHRLVAALFGTLVTLNIAWSQALPEPQPLTAAQEASIREEMTALAAMLVSGGKSQQDARLATHAVGTCIGVGYGYGLTREQADRVCGLVLDAFIIEPGTVYRPLTPDDRAWMSEKVMGWSGELSAVLGPDEVMAVQSTMTACLTGQLQRGESRGDAVGRCALGLMPLLNMPELSQRLVEAAGRR